MKLGKIQQVDLREVWPHEASSFTPWLEANPHELGEILGLDLEFVREKPIGKFSLDLFGTDVSTGRRVIVENQLEQSNHNHLGQLLTYAGGSEPQVIVWVAKSIRQEHRAALEWLNSVTSNDVQFFGIEVKAIKIGDSLPAPMLDIVVEPNSWAKEIKGSVAGQFESDRAKTYSDFWRNLIDDYSSTLPELASRTPWARNWLPTSVGISGVNVNLVFTSQGIRVETYFGSSDPEINERRFEAALAKKQEIEERVGGKLLWERLDGKKACRISMEGPVADVEENQNWPAYSFWFSTAFRLMRDATSTFIIPAVKTLT